MKIKALVFEKVIREMHLVCDDKLVKGQVDEANDKGFIVKEVIYEKDEQEKKSGFCGFCASCNKLLLDGWPERNDWQWADASVKGREGKICRECLQKEAKS